MGIDTGMLPLYLNLVFFGMLGLGMLFGFLKGLRKSLYSLIVKLAFYILFFATLGFVSRFLWNVEFGFIGSTLSMVMSELSSANSLSEALPIAIESMLGDQLNADLSNPEFVAFAEGVGMFAIKIVYAILYFTVIQVIYRFIMWVVYLIFFKPKKEDVEVHGKKRLAGMGVGLFSGALAVYATLVLLGGVMNIAENLATLAEGIDNDETTASVPTETYDVNDDSVLRLANRDETLPLQTQNQELDSALSELNAIVSAYNENLVVQNFTRVNMTDEDTGRKTPLNLHLFDMIFSFEYKDDDIAFRGELAVFTDAAALFLNSEYQESNDLSDIEGADVEALFDSLSNSRLLTNLVPLAIEMGAEHYDVDLALDRDEIYAIDYQTELSQIGSVFGVAFDMLNTAGVFNEDADFDTVTLDGDDAQSIFEGLGDSELATLGAYVAMEPLLEQLATDSGAILTVPEGIVWEDEFDAFGEVAKEILDTDITLGDIRSGDIMTYLQRLSSMDLTVILRSSIIEQALVNVLSGAAEIEGMDMMIVNDDVQWTDEIDDGDIVQKGELRIVLEALNTFADNEDVDAIESFDQNVLLNISEDTLDAFLDSEVLTDTIGDFIVNLETDAIVIPPSALRTITVDETDRDVVTREEIRNMFLAVQTIDIDDFETVDFSADLLSTLEDEDAPGTLDDDKSDTLFDSVILHATVSRALIDLTEDGSDALVVPDEDIGETAIRSTDPDDSSIEYISTVELKAILEAVIVLDLTDFENLESLDAETIANEIDTLLNSAIIHATFSDQLLTLHADDTIVVPYYAEDDTTKVRITVSGTEYISKTELETSVDALDTLDILDFDNFDGNVDLSILENDTNRDAVLASSILQATVSKQLIDLHEDETIVLPYYNQDDTEAIRTLSTAGEEDIEYVDVDELDALIQALEVLDILDIESFDGTVDLSVLETEANRDTVLASKTLQATVSKQLVDLHEDETIVLPYYDDEDDTQMRMVSSAGDEPIEYVIVEELDRLIQALDVLDILDIESFDGTVDLTALEDSPDNRDTVVSSLTLQATLTEQLLDLENDGTIILPYYNEADDTLLRKTSTAGDEPIEFVIKSELDHLLEAMDVLELLNVEAFDGAVDLDVLAQGSNASTVLSSSIIQATVSDQVIDLDSDGTIDVPYIDVDDATDIRVLADSHDTVDTEYVAKSELEALIQALDILGITDVETFTGTITLNEFYDESNRNTLLESSVMHATISGQLFDLGASTLVVPEEDVDADPVQYTTENASNNTTYVLDGEIHSIIEGLEVLGIEDINDFDGSVDLDAIFGDPAKQDTLLSSASIHATIVQQIDDTLGTSVLLVPDEDLDDTTVRTSAEFEGAYGTREYITKDELKSLINSMEVLGITDITDYDGSFSLNDLEEEADQDRLLESASIHATFSRELFDLDDAVLIVPDTEEDGTTKVRDDNSLGEDYVVQNEIKTLIDAFLAMGYSDLDGFGSEIESSKFFDSRDTLLLSSSIQATVSNKLLNDTNDALVVPDENTAGDEVRLLSDTYIESGELDALLDALDELGLEDFDTMDFTPTNVFASDYESMIEDSATVQMTLSDVVLENAYATQGDTSSPTDLVVPNSLRNQLPVGGTDTDQVEKDELIDLFTGLDTVGVSAFDGTVDAGAVTGMSATDLNTVLESGSLHVTVDNMIDDNGSITIPDYDDANNYDYDAVNADQYGLTDITKKAEIVDFVVAVNVVADPDDTIQNISFDLSTIQSLSGSDQDTIAESMIVRDTLTPDIETAYNTTVGGSIPDSYYHDDDDTIYLDPEGFTDALDEIEASSP